MEEENPLEVLSRAASIVQDLELHSVLDDQNQRHIQLDSQVTPEFLALKCRKDPGDEERQREHNSKKFKLYDASCVEVEENNDVSVDETDGPLDMSLGKSGESASHIYDHGLNYYPRPSVITCISALRNPVSVTPKVLSELAVSTEDPSCDSSMSDSLNNECPRERIPSESRVPERRREVFSESCDPVIDEHFRRSLGKDYQTLFSTTADATSNNIAVPAGQIASDATGMSVDDHFAKALGETWLRLQSKNKEDKKDEGLNNNGQPATPMLSSRSSMVTT